MSTDFPSGKCYRNMNIMSLNIMVKGRLCNIVLLLPFMAPIVCFAPPFTLNYRFTHRVNCLKRTSCFMTLSILPLSDQLYMLVVAQAESYSTRVEDQVFVWCWKQIFPSLSTVLNLYWGWGRGGGSEKLPSPPPSSRYWQH